MDHALQTPLLGLSEVGILQGQTVVATLTGSHIEKHTVS